MYVGGGGGGGLLTTVAAAPLTARWPRRLGEVTSGCSPRRLSASSRCSSTTMQSRQSWPTAPCARPTASHSEAKQRSVFRTGRTR